MPEFTVAKEDEISNGEHIVAQVQGREIGVFQIDDKLYAFTNWCAHQSGPICEGYLGGTTEATFDLETLETTTEWIKEGEILTCPWHGWEYDIITGDCLSKNGIKLPKHDVRIEDGEIIVSL